jgi:hypothetical protein
METVMKKVLFVAATLLLFVVPSALACETCIEIPPPDYYRCNSGDPAGAQWCYGGFGQYCTMGGKCTGGGPAAQTAGDDTLVTVLNGSLEAPREGFILERAETETDRQGDTRS